MLMPQLLAQQERPPILSGLQAKEQEATSLGQRLDEMATLAWHKVAEPSGIPEGQRLHACIEVRLPGLLRPHRASPNLATNGPTLLHMQGRFLTLLRLEGKVSAIDSICFHAGGPLVRRARGPPAPAARHARSPTRRCSAAASEGGRTGAT
jgi:nitrite reductase/ring-hydroxylating ferredoxin subunit